MTKDFTNWLTVRLLWTIFVYSQMTGNTVGPVRVFNDANPWITIQLPEAMTSHFPRTIHASVRRLSLPDHGPILTDVLLERIHRQQVPIYTENVTRHLTLEDDTNSVVNHATFASEDGNVLVLLERQTNRNIQDVVISGIVYHAGIEYSILPTDLRASFTDIKLQPVSRNVPQSHQYVISEKSTIHNIDNVSIDIHPTVRRQRDVTYPTLFTVDVLAVVDYSVFSTWRRHNGVLSTDEEETKQLIRQYYSHVFTGVDLRFSKIDFLEFQFRIKLVGLTILTKNRQYPWTVSVNTNNGGKLLAEAETVLGNFRDWVNETNDLPTHDHAILFTGYDLYSKDPETNVEINHTSGLAYIGTLCGSGDSVSIVEEPGGFQGIGTTAHEIGHSLGALHDGENNTCRSADRYIMASSGFGPVPEDRKLNPWHFSPCSLEYFRSFVAKQVADGSTCLINTEPILVPVETGITLPYQLPGQRYSPDQQCKLIWGPESYMCRGAEFGDSGSVCTALYCRDPNSQNDCVLHTAARGTSCGHKQWCIDGKCVNARQAPPKIATCVHGDQPGVAFNDKTCSQLILESASYCYQEKVRARCCQSCGNQHTGVRGCEYGDLISGCKAYHCGSEFESSGLRQNCCRTCGVGIAVDRRTTMAPLPVNLEDKRVPKLPEVQGCYDVYSYANCRNYVKTHGLHVCYGAKLAERCCKTCQSLKSPIKGCSFGDRTPSLCDRVANMTRLTCTLHGQHCCQSCHKFESQSSKAVDIVHVPMLQSLIFLCIYVLFKLT